MANKTTETIETPEVINEAAETETVEAFETEIIETSAPRKIELLIGVNFIATGESEETRVEPNQVIDSGVMPARFEAELIEAKKAKYV